MPKGQGKSLERILAKKLKLWATLIALFLSGAVVVLSLLGYGAAIAIESLFGIPHTYAYDSTLDLLALSSYTIMAAVDFSVEVLESQGFNAATYIAAITGVVLTIILLALNSKKIAIYVKQLKGCVIRFPGDAFLSKKFDVLREKLLSKRFCFLPLSLGAVPLITLVVITSLFLVPAFFPLWGYALGRQHFQKWIIEADSCSPIRSQQERLAPHKPIDTNVGEKKPRLALCLALWKDGERIAAGLHIISTSSHIMLFDPITGNVRIEPVHGVSVQSVAQLPIWPALSQDLTSAPCRTRPIFRTTPPSAPLLPGRRLCDDAHFQTSKGFRFGCCVDAFGSNLR